MATFLLKNIRFVLLFFSVFFISSVVAQVNSDRSPTAINIRDFSPNEGILSKIKSFFYNKKGHRENQSLYSNKFLDQKHGLERRNNDYDYLEHLGTGMDIPYASITDASGNTYITGAGSNVADAKGDFITIKINTNGDVIWEKRQPGTLYAVEYGIEISMDQAGNPIATGIFWNGNDLDVFTIKYDQNTGNEIWSSTFDGGNDAFDVPTTMLVDSNDSVFIGGITYSGSSVEYMLLKFDANGQLIWSSVDTNPISVSWNEPSAIAVDSLGNIALTGYAAVDGTSQGYWEGYLTILYDSTGNQVWRKPFLFERNLDETDPTSEIINTHSAAKGIAFDSDGNLIVTGTFDVTSATRMGTIKYDLSGNELWIKTYRAGESNDDITNGIDIKITEENKIYVVGRHRGDWANEGLVLISYSDEGQENWIEENNNIIQIQNAEMILDADNLPIIAGLGNDEGTQDLRVRIFRYSESGVILKETSYLKPYSSTEGIGNFMGLSVDNEDNVFITLNNYYTSKGGVFETVKMPFDSGANNPDWTTVFDTPLSASGTNMLDGTHDSENNSYATGEFGEIINNQYFRNFFLAKYNDQGEVTWQKKYNLQNGNESNGIVAKVDQDNNIVVFLIPDPYSNLPIRIKKYSTTGNLLWEMEKEVQSPLFRSFFIDQENNIYMAGSALENPSDPFPVFAVTKISSSGTELWSQYADTGNPDDNVFEINSGKVSSEGDIYVTGVSGYRTMFSEVVDLTVLKFSSDGNLNWLQKYPQPNNGSAGIDILLNDSNAMFVCGVQQDPINQTEELVALKIDTEGEVIWSTTYGQTAASRRIRPYQILENSEGDLLIPSYSLYWVLGEPTNNRITTIRLNKEDGNLEWENNTEINRFYRDSYIDGNDNFFILNQASEFEYRRLSSNTIAALTTIDTYGENMEEQFFSQPQLADFNPATLIPLSNNKLLLGGTLSGDDFFRGLFFFETTHIPLGINDNNTPLDPSTEWLGQNYPNPVKNLTTIPFNLENDQKMSLIIFDNLGRSVFNTTQNHYFAGKNTIQVDLSDLTPGIYFYKFKNGKEGLSRKLIKR